MWVGRRESVSAVEWEARVRNMSCENVKKEIVMVRYNGEDRRVELGVGYGVCWVGGLA